MSIAPFSSINYYNCHGFCLGINFWIDCCTFKIPALVGYLLARVTIGPFTPGLVADPSIAEVERSGAQFLGADAMISSTNGIYQYDY